MTFSTRAVLTCALIAALPLAGCKKPAESAQTAAPGDAPAASQAATASMPAPAPSARFDVGTLPVSSTALGAFPYIGLPEGYEPNGLQTSAFEQVPFWTGDRLEPVEGQVWSAGVYPADGKTFSGLELSRNIASLVQAMGGQKIFEGKLPAQATADTNAWPNGVATRFVAGLGDIYNDPSQTFVIHRQDRDIWVHLCVSLYNAGLLVVETKPVQITATLLPASALKAQIDTTGKVALHVNFATDKTDILPDSQPQIAQVVALLAQDPALALAVNGYTDNSGDAAHNKVLSEGRAKAVVAALVAQGIAAQRLTAAGYGDADPVADNASEQGKAQNRRVELVKQG